MSENSVGITINKLWRFLGNYDCTWGECVDGDTNNGWSPEIVEGVKNDSRIIMRVTTEIDTLRCEYRKMCDDNGIVQPWLDVRPYGAMPCFDDHELKLFLTPKLRMSDELKFMIFECAVDKMGLKRGFGTFTQVKKWESEHECSGRAPDVL
jgi:hypothetical protein